MRVIAMIKPYSHKSMINRHKTNYPKTSEYRQLNQNLFSTKIMKPCLGWIHFSAFAILQSLNILKWVGKQTCRATAIPLTIPLSLRWRPHGNPFTSQKTNPCHKNRKVRCDKIGRDFGDQSQPRRALQPSKYTQ